MVSRRTVCALRASCVEGASLALRLMLGVSRASGTVGDAAGTAEPAAVA